MVRLETLISTFIERTFPGYEVLGQGMFRVIRDSDIEVEEEAEDLVQLFESALKRRRRGSVIRLKLDANMPDSLQSLVQNELQVDNRGVIAVDGLVGLSQTAEIIDYGTSELKVYAVSRRVFRSAFASMAAIVFRPLAQKIFWFTTLMKVLMWWCSFCAKRRLTLMWWQLSRRLYRTTEDSPIVESLIEAAEAGKSVTALVELKARFDEAANIRLARDMERAGVQVVLWLYAAENPRQGKFGGAP